MTADPRDLVVRGLTKRLRERSPGHDRIDLHVHAGEVFGLLGPRTAPE